MRSTCWRGLRRHWRRGGSTGDGPTRRCGSPALWARAISFRSGLAAYWARGCSARPIRCAARSSRRRTALPARSPAASSRSSCGSGRTEFALQLAARSCCRFASGSSSAASAASSPGCPITLTGFRPACRGRWTSATGSGVIPSSSMNHCRWPCSSPSMFAHALRNARWARDHAFHAMIIFYAGQRFLWEFLKPYPAVLGPLNIFHILMVGLVAYGLFWWRRSSGRELRSA